MNEIKYDKRMGRWDVYEGRKLLGFIAPQSWEWKFVTEPRHEEPFPRTESRKEMEAKVLARYGHPLPPVNP